MTLPQYYTPAYGWGTLTLEKLEKKKPKEKCEPSYLNSIYKLDVQCWWQLRVGLKLIPGVTVLTTRYINMIATDALP